MQLSVSAARGLPTRANSRRAGVAQSVAQLSCKQQVRGSSPLASSKCLVRPAFLFGILDRPPGNPQLSDPIVLVLLQPARVTAKAWRTTRMTSGPGYMHVLWSFRGLGPLTSSMPSTVGLRGGPARGWQLITPSAVDRDWARGLVSSLVISVGVRRSTGWGHTGGQSSFDYLVTRPKLNAAAVVHAWPEGVPGPEAVRDDDVGVRPSYGRPVFDIRPSFGVVLRQAGPSGWR